MKKILLALAVVAVLAGCANVVKVSPGDAVVADRIRVPVDAAWNQFNPPFVAGKVAAMWTQEGLAIDQLNFYVGLKDGDEVAAAQSDKQRALVFKSAMQPHELGQRGWRAQYTVVRKFDEVRLSGSAWGTVRNNELYAMTFAAPAVGFYPRLSPKVEKVVAAARFK